ncbi:hypothetical protein CEUSTIGMA_g9975.t1 [Chlamydomonas eustigma]|uniref:Cation/H+ exchanger domain-containing protein n=1 Tax=Chlamydomonas eustigma TaxID=1157962 RepID=A0A250XI05_9CHLO|nr:hypothetical protein CEUSTIGMA_g9975.t1 [Chlamydomonas eustigma]|eukprot:GAX82549.1 hypothetical protein CEUSTIGMA_g9975.t1 [Chlamydomonas eustigma]
MDFFLLKKVLWLVMFMAFVMVLASALILIPFMMYAMQLNLQSWNAIYVALFGTMIGSTDAASVIAILKSGGAPEILSIVLEGESLFNDASSLTMFEIFKGIVAHKPQSLASDVSTIVVNTITSFLGGTAIGIGMALFVMVTLRWLQLRDMKGYIEINLTLAATYLSYYITQVWVQSSGVIAVVIFGLIGSATMQWGISQKVLQTRALFTFYDVLVFLLNGIIFVFVGASSTNLMIRADSFIPGDNGEVLLRLFWQSLVVYVFSFLTRMVLVLISAFVFGHVMRVTEKIDIKQMVFISLAGLRGSLSLILVQTIIELSAENKTSNSNSDPAVLAEIAMMTTMYVLFTLLINAPLLGPLLSVMGLNAVSQEQLHLRKRVQTMLQRHAEVSFAQVRANSDELLQGVAWDEVEAVISHWSVRQAGQPATGQHPASGSQEVCSTCWSGLLSCLCCSKQAGLHNSSDNPGDTDSKKTPSKQRTSFYSGWNLDLLRGISTMFIARSNAANVKEEDVINVELAEKVREGSRRPAKLSTEVESPVKDVALGSDEVHTDNSTKDVKVVLKDSYRRQASAIAFDPSAWDEDALAAAKAAGIWTGTEAERSRNPVFEADLKKGEQKLDAILENYVAEAALEDCELVPENEAQQSLDRQHDQGLSRLPSRRPTMKRIGSHPFSHMTQSLRELKSPLDRIVDKGEEQAGTKNSTFDISAKTAYIPPNLVHSDVDGTLPGDSNVDGTLPGDSNVDGTLPGDSKPHNGHLPTDVLSPVDLTAAPSSIAQPEHVQPAPNDISVLKPLPESLNPATVVPSHVVLEVDGVEGGKEDQQQPALLHGSSSVPLTIGYSAWSSSSAAAPPAEEGAGLHPIAAQSMPSHYGQHKLDITRGGQDGDLSTRSREFLLSNSRVSHMVSTHGAGSSVLANEQSSYKGGKLIRKGQMGPIVETIHSQPLNHDSHPLGRASKGKQLETVTRGHTAFNKILEEEDEEGADEVLSEYRMRFTTSLRQHFRRRRHEGMLGDKSFRILDLACKEQLHSRLDEPFHLWEIVEGDISKHWTIQSAARLQFKMKKSMLKIRGKAKSWWRSALIWLWKGPTYLMDKYLGHLNRIAVEIAIELWLALDSNNQTLWLEHSGAAGERVMAEVKKQASMVWPFVMDRKIESPERFQAVQTYRVKLALLTQQETFVQELAEDGVLEESEEEKLLYSLLRQRQFVERAGPSKTHATGLINMLSNLELFRGISKDIIRMFRTGNLKVFGRGEVIWDHTSSVKSGIIIVIWGSVRCVVDVNGEEVEYYMGSGAAIGLIGCVIGAYVPGIMAKTVYGEGNAMGRGPVVMIIPWSVMELVQQLSREQGLQEFKELDLRLMLTSVSYLMEAMKARTMASLMGHVQQLLLQVLKDSFQHCLDLRRAAEDTGAVEGKKQSAPSPVPNPPPLSVKQVNTVLQVAPSDDNGLAMSLLSLPYDEGFALVSGMKMESQYLDLKENLARHIADRCTCLFGEVCKMLASGQLVMLKPGEKYIHQRTAMLLQGCLLPQHCTHGSSSYSSSQESPAEPSSSMSIDSIEVVQGKSEVSVAETLKEVAVVGTGPADVTDPRVIGGGGGACVIMEEARSGRQSVTTQQAPALLLWSPDFFESLYNAASYPKTIEDEVLFVVGPLGAQLVVSYL